MTIRGQGAQGTQSAVLTRGLVHRSPMQKRSLHPWGAQEVEWTHVGFPAGDCGADCAVTRNLELGMFPLMLTVLNGDDSTS